VLLTNGGCWVRRDKGTDNRRKASVKVSDAVIAIMV